MRVLYKIFVENVVLPECMVAIINSKYFILVQG